MDIAMHTTNIATRTITPSAVENSAFNDAVPLIKIKNSIPKTAGQHT